MFLLSDACPGQNRNYTVSRFLLLAAVVYNVDIMQLFPVRGHSYNQCDRNFGLYSKKVQQMESIETPEEYFDIIRNSRNPPFTIREGHVYDFEEVVKPYFF